MFGEDDEVTAYAYRPIEEQLVSVARLYCSECDRQRLSTLHWDAMSGWLRLGSR